MNVIIIDLVNVVANPIKKKSANDNPTNVVILFIVILFLKYKDISKLSAYLMIPYFLWCSYALLLNFNLMILN